MDRHAKLLWMKELLEHLEQCHEAWLMADEQTERYLAESMKRDLDEIRRLCDALRTESPVRPRSLAAA